jgi:hypothetical protein
MRAVRRVGLATAGMPRCTEERLPVNEIRLMSVGFYLVRSAAGSLWRSVAW